MYVKYPKYTSFKAAVKFNFNFLATKIKPPLSYAKLKQSYTNY